MRKTPSVYEVERAQSFLLKHGMAGKVTALSFAGAAKETGKSFERLLSYIRELLSGGSGIGPSPVATRIALKGNAP